MDTFSGLPGPLCREFTGHRWILLTKASDAELWYFLDMICPEQTLVIWDATALIMTSLQWLPDDLSVRRCRHVSMCASLSACMQWLSDRTPWKSSVSIECFLTCINISDKNEQIKVVATIYIRLSQVISSICWHEKCSKICQIVPVVKYHHWYNTLRPGRNGRHFADDIFQCIFLTENACISIKISLKFVHKGPINKISALVQIMARRRPGDKPLP